MPSSFRPYTKEELRRAAQEYAIDPAFVEAVYAVESSNGTDPNAMTARSVKRKRDRTIVRGPFQLEDDTVSDVIKKHKLGAVNVDDPDTHLDLAMRLMSDLRDRYDGDYRKMAQAYLGGPGGVTNPNAKDELGTSTGTYGNKILAEMARLGGEGGGERVAPPRSRPSLPPMENDISALPSFGDSTSPFMHGADAGPLDMFGMSEDMLAMPTPGRGGWGDLVAANRSPVGLGIPDEMGGDLPSMPELDYASTIDIDQYLSGLVNEEMDGRDYRA